MHVAIKICVFEEACCNEVVLCCVHNVTPNKVKAAVKRLKPSGGVMKEFNNVNIVGATEFCQLFRPIVGMAAVVNEHERAGWHLETP